MRMPIAILAAAGIALSSTASLAAEKLVISVWGGSWSDLVAADRGQEVQAETGADVEFITGGTIDRLNKAKLAKGNPESDITFTTSHVGWLYANDGLYRDARSGEDPERQVLVDQAKISPYHIGTWAYVYTIGYRPDLMQGREIRELGGPVEARAQGQARRPGFRSEPHRRSGGDALRRRRGELGKGPGEAQGAEAELQGVLHQRRGPPAADANGETPVQVMLSMNAYYMKSQGVPIEIAIPKEGAVLGIDTIGIMKGSKKSDLAYKFINVCSILRCRPRSQTSRRAAQWSRTPSSRRKWPSCRACSRTPEQWSKEAIVIDHKLRAEKTAEWRKWFTENIMN